MKLKQLQPNSCSRKYFVAMQSEKECSHITCINNMITYIVAGASIV